MTKESSPLTLPLPFLRQLTLNASVDSFDKGWIGVQRSALTLHFDYTDRSRRGRVQPAPSPASCLGRNSSQDSMRLFSSFKLLIKALALPCLTNSQAGSSCFGAETCSVTNTCWI